MRFQLLFSLLRYALGTERPEDGVVLEKLTLEEWNEVFDLAGKQNVIAIAHDGLDAAAANGVAVGRAVKEADEENGCEVWSDFVSVWGANVYALEQKYKDYRATIASLARFWNEHNLRMLLLKGYGLSLNWPTPKHRPCGDIDVFLCEEGSMAQSAGSNGSNASLGSSDLSASKKGDRLIREELGIKVNDENKHHSKFMYQGWSVENHHSFMEQDAYHSNRLFERELQQWVAEDREGVVADGVALDIPAPSLMALHLTRHAGCDFASNSISVRQLLDWALFVNKRSEEVDWDRVTDIIDRMGMRGFLDLMNDLSVNVLGLSKEKFPPFKENRKLRERALNDILFALRVNEFPDYHHKFIYGLTKTRQAWRNRWKNRLVFNESFVLLYWQKASNRMKN